MAHEKIYGICEDKCREEVYGVKDVYNKDEINDIVKAKANASHATSEATNGLATSVLYGHVKLTTDIKNAPKTDKGIALAGSAGQRLYQEIKTAYIPVGNVAFTVKHVDANEFAKYMKYGTWVYLGEIAIANEGESNTIVRGFLRNA